MRLVLKDVRYEFIIKSSVLVHNKNEFIIKSFVLVLNKKEFIIKLFVSGGKAAEGKGVVRD